MARLQSHAGLILLNCTLAARPTLHHKHFHQYFLTYTNSMYRDCNEQLPKDLAGLNHIFIQLQTV